MTISTERTFIFRVQNEKHFGWCEECQAEVALINVAGAAQVFGLSQIEVFRLVDTHSVHFYEDPEGQLLICLRSHVGQ